MRRAEADPDTRRVAVSLVIADERVVGVIRRPVVCRRDGLLEIGIGQRDDVSGPGPQCGEIHPALEVRPLPGVRIGAGATYFHTQDVHRPCFNSFIRASPRASDPCIAGTETWDANFIYVCVAKNTWKRAPLASW